MQTRTPMKAIRAKCLDCSCYQPKEVRLCTVMNCPLWPFRMGKRPKKEAPQELVTVDGKG
jgi:hypothetical protein